MRQFRQKYLHIFVLKQTIRRMSGDSANACCRFITSLLSSIKPTRFDCKNWKQKEQIGIISKEKDVTFLQVLSFANFSQFFAAVWNEENGRGMKARWIEKMLNEFATKQNTFHTKIETQLIYWCDFYYLLFFAKAVLLSSINFALLYYSIHKLLWVERWRN